MRGYPQSWEYDSRFEELEDGGEDRSGGVILDDKQGQERFVSDELYFDGLNTQAARRRRSRHDYDESSSFSGEEEILTNPHTLARRVDLRHTLTEEEVVEQALERVKRAQALGKTNVKLSQAELDALNRLEARTDQQQLARRTGSIPSTTPRSRKPSPAKTKVISPEQRRLSHAERSLDGSPQPRKRVGRIRAESNASDRSFRDALDHPSSFDPYNYPPQLPVNYAPGYFVPSYPVSRTASNQSLRQMHTRHQQPHYQPRYQGNPDDYESRPPRRLSRPSRPDLDDFDYEYIPRSRSNSGMIAYPIDQLPHHLHSNRAPRFDPTDPRYGSPQRRIVSDPPAHSRPHRRHHHDDDDVFEDVQPYESTSSEASEDSGQGLLKVSSAERSGASHPVRITRSSAARSGASGRSTPKKDSR